MNNIFELAAQALTAFTEAEKARAAFYQRAAGTPACLELAETAGKLAEKAKTEPPAAPVAPAKTDAPAAVKTAPAAPKKAAEQPSEKAAQPAPAKAPAPAEKQAPANPSAPAANVAQMKRTTTTPKVEEKPVQKTAVETPQNPKAEQAATKAKPAAKPITHERAEKLREAFFNALVKELHDESKDPTQLREFVIEHNCRKTKEIPDDKIEELCRLVDEKFGIKVEGYSV